MSKLPYEAAESTVEPTYDVVLFSGDNAYIDPWNIVEKLEL